MTHVSLFSGIGGIDLAAGWAGFRTTAICEIDPLCRRVLARHFPNADQFKDIRDITDGSIESPTLVSAGFPCQPFSIAGSRQGTSDERHLWPEVVRVLGFLKPRWFLGENVRGLLSISEGRVFGSILADLAHLGYRVGWGCYGADEACGAPHRRDRVFIVGYLAHGSKQCGDGCHGQSKCEVSELGNESSPMAHPIGGGCRGRDNGDAPELRREVQAEGPRGELADASCERRQQIAPGTHGDEGSHGEEYHHESSSALPAVVYTTGIRRERCGTEDADERCRMPDACERHSPFPPGPADLDAWREVLRERPDLAPSLTAEEEIELSVRPVDDGVLRRMALRMLGNAVVPQQVYPILQAIADHIQGNQ